MLDLEFQSTIKGNQLERVSLKFTNPMIYVDAAGNPVQATPLNGYLSPFEYIDPSTKE